MRQFKWIEWNLQKIGAHHLSAEEVEAAFDQAFQVTERDDGSFQMYAEVPSGRRIWVIWRYDREDQELPDVFGEVEQAPIFCDHGFGLLKGVQCNGCSTTRQA